MMIRNVDVMINPVNVKVMKNVEDIVVVLGIIHVDVNVLNVFVKTAIQIVAVI